MLPNVVFPRMLWCAVPAIVSLRTAHTRSDGTIFSIYSQTNCRSCDTFGSDQLNGTSRFLLRKKAISRSVCTGIGICAATMDTDRLHTWRARTMGMKTGEPRRNVMMRTKWHCEDCWESSGRESRKTIRHEKGQSRIWFKSRAGCDFRFKCWGQGHPNI